MSSWFLSYSSFSVRSFASLSSICFSTSALVAAKAATSRARRSYPALKAFSSRSRSARSSAKSSSQTSSQTPAASSAPSQQSQIPSATFDGGTNSEGCCGQEKRDRFLVLFHVQGVVRESSVFEAREYRGTGGQKREFSVR